MQSPGHSHERCEDGVPCRALVRFSTETGVKGTGRIRVIGTHGAFIETGAELRVGTPLKLLVLGNDSAPHVVEIDATVVGSESYGVEVEWQERRNCPICAVIGCSVPC